MDIERDLAQHRLATLQAIESGRVELAIRRLKAYVNFAQAFLDVASKRGIFFSLDAARQVSILDWRTPTQIIDNAQDGILAAVKSGNLELIAGASYIPIQFMKMSTENRDFLFYRKMSQVYPMMLATSYAINSNSGKELVVDRSWRYLREFGDFFIPKLTAAQDQKMREQFSSELLWRFGDLMKVAMDHNDTSTFATIGREMDAIFLHLEIAGLSQEASSLLRDFVAQERSIIWFGLGAWIIRSFVLAGTPRTPGQPDPRLIDPTKITAFLEVVSNKFQNIKQLAGVYERSLLREHESSTWEWWLMETLSEREAHWIDFRRWVTYFYVVVGLRLSKEGNLAPIDIPDPFRDLQYVISDIREKVTQVKENKQHWAPLIPWLKTQPTISQTGNSLYEYFISANEAAIKEWTSRRENEIIQSPLDPQHVATFREECLRGWHERSWLVKALSSLGRCVDKSAEVGTTYMAVDLLIPKEAFIKSSDAQYVGFGYEQGAILGRDISAHLMSLIENKAVVVEKQGTSSFVDKAMEIVATISVEKSSIGIFIIGDINLKRQFSTTKGFSQRETQSKPRFNFTEYIGDISGIPIFFIFDDQVTRIIVADTVRMGRLVWYYPQQDNMNGLLMRITEFNELEAGRVIDEQPKFLKLDDGTERSRKDAIRDLRLKVRVFIGVKIDLEIEAVDAIKEIHIS